MEEINIKEFFKYVKKYVLIIGTISIIMCTLTLIYSVYIKRDMYETSTTLVLTKSTNTVDQTGTITQNDILLNQKLVSTYSELVKSKLVLNQVIEDLSLDYKINELAKLISVDSVEDTEILKITVKNEEPKLAKNIANETAKIFSKEIVDIYNINNISIIDKAILPKTVSNNTIIRDSIIALFGSVLVSLVILFIKYYFDDTLKLDDDLEEKINLPILGKVGIEKFNKKTDEKTELIVSKYPKSVVSEGIKSLRTNLQFSAVDKQVKSILITSSIPGEGKSFISANLATAFAQTGKNVLLVDCDMRKGRQHKIFNISNARGYSNLLIDDFKNNYSSYIKNTEVKNLYLLTCGTVPPNPSELLNSDRNKELIKFLTSKFDIVIFDGVPCNGLPDSAIMSTLIDKTLIVSAENITPKSLLENTKKTILNVGSKVSGIIVNKINMKNNKYYGKYYSYYGENK